MSAIADLKTHPEKPLPKAIIAAATEVITQAALAGHTVKACSWWNPASTPEHSSNVAVDFMVYGDKATGDWVANYIWKHRARLGICWEIWYRHIRSTSPGHSGNWETYTGKSAHTDHVHVNFGRLAGKSGYGSVPKVSYKALAKVPTVKTTGLPEPRFTGLELIVPGEAVKDAGLSWQCAVQRNDTNDWYLSQATELGTNFHRFDAKGKYLGHMFLYKGGHNTAFGITNAGKIYATCNDDENDIVSFKWQAGALIRKNATRQEHVFSDKPTQIALSPTRSHAIIREFTSAEVETYRRYSMTDIASGTDNQLGHAIAFKRNNNDPVVQGFTCYGEFLYRMTGAKNGRCYIEKWSFKSGYCLAKMDITDVGYLPGEKRDAWEPEGMDGTRFGVKVYPKGKKMLRIFDVKF